MACLGAPNFKLLPLGTKLNLLFFLSFDISGFSGDLTILFGLDNDILRFTADCEYDDVIGEKKLSCLCKRRDLLVFPGPVRLPFPVPLSLALSLFIVVQIKFDTLKY